MIIGIMPDPTHCRDWNKIEAYLQPAADLGGIPIIEDHHEVWTVHDGDDIVAAATARLTTDGHGEIVLCGGRDAEQWAEALSDKICAWFQHEGMTCAHIYGRTGWKRLLTKWDKVGMSGKFTVLERVL